jgi:hypothetical protein
MFECCIHARQNLNRVMNFSLFATVMFAHSLIFQYLMLAAKSCNCSPLRFFFDDVRATPCGC